MEHQVPKYRSLSLIHLFIQSVTRLPTKKLSCTQFLLLETLPWSIIRLSEFLTKSQEKVECWCLVVWKGNSRLKSLCFGGLKREDSPIMAGSIVEMEKERALNFTGVKSWIYSCQVAEYWGDGTRNCWRSWTLKTISQEWIKSPMEKEDRSPKIEF